MTLSELLNSLEGEFNSVTDAVEIIKSNPNLDSDTKDSLVLFGNIVASAIGNTGTSVVQYLMENK